MAGVSYSGTDIGTSWEKQVITTSTLAVGCWCPGDARGQGISSHTINNAGQVETCLPQGKDLITYANLLLRNNRQMQTPLYDAWMTKVWIMNTNNERDMGI